MTGSHIRNRFWLPNMALAPALAWAAPWSGPRQAPPDRAEPRRQGRGREPAPPRDHRFMRPSTLTICWNVGRFWNGNAPGLLTALVIRGRF